MLNTRSVPHGQKRIRQCAKHTKGNTMNYIEIITKQEALAAQMEANKAEFDELTKARIAVAQSHISLEAEHKVGDLEIELDLDYDERGEHILSLLRGDNHINLTVTEFNGISAFLGKYNDAIFSYMSEITKKVEDEEATDETA